MRKRMRKRVQVAALVACGALALVIFLRRGDDVRAPEPPACELGATVPGIDVSYYQPSVSWKRVRKAGVRFAFIRVSDGSTFEDPKFASHWTGAKRAGLLRGAYQYFRPDEDPTAQAELVIAALARDPGDLPPVIDIETDGGKSPSQIVAAARVWIDRVRDKLGVEPIVYTGPDFWRTRANGGDLTTQPLWIAHYTRGCPTVPAPWTAWTFWQHSETGRVSGVKGKVDLNVFAGTHDQLVELARRSRRRR